MFITQFNVYEARITQHQHKLESNDYPKFSNRHNNDVLFVTLKPQLVAVLDHISPD